MTPQHAKRLLPIIQAFAEGKTIQCDYGMKEKRWYDEDCIQWEANGSWKYRIKSEEA